MLNSHWVVLVQSYEISVSCQNRGRMHGGFIYTSLYWRMVLILDLIHLTLFPILTSAILHCSRWCFLAFRFILYHHWIYFNTHTHTSVRIFIVGFVHVKCIFCSCYLVARAYACMIFTPHTFNYCVLFFSLHSLLPSIWFF